MLEQGLHRGVGSGQFGFSQQRMNLPMTDSMQIFGLTAALAFGHQMMPISLRSRNIALAQRAGQRSASQISLRRMNHGVMGAL